ncbi:hypothetical protein [Chloracidobacterium aggregatum]|jgi:PKD repeat protein|uniref:DUF4845 domain-containing protein n=1 Tax=Chloracidobacterium sp. N TaxID=2821540 RepID=A0ABX8B1S2_9BACT|nr:hypothetical protein [Chloracidobacterium aggregatum]QUV84797.1 hypothetical protein J8C03_00450 [Chloracidobacterium sp. 2]QUV88802.1 hypothetical protein J8C07_05700 [Chloracidobacterium sp. S]QUV94894.1 hypothetical protein J8C05_05510 [Chloracidobacterium sp. N]QUV96006.1 hypothetical protein J8C00_06610 [Chloracidobacterium sp. E]QUW00948.1 hypothetical protein J8C02_05525 [Chloracidobacterium sp. MS 40/45]
MSRHFVLRRPVRATERGEGQGQLIAVVTIVAIIGFIIFKTLPVYWREQNVRNELTDMARKYAIGAKGFATEKELEGQWLKISNEFNVPQEAKFTADRQGGKVILKVQYTEPINYLVYTYDWEVNAEASDSIGRY